MTKKIVNSSWLLVISVALAIAYIYAAYYASLPDRFIKTIATIQSIELNRYESKGGRYFIDTAYKYTVNNRMYLESDKHFLPQKFYSVKNDNKELQLYLSRWRNAHAIGSEMVISIHSWSPNLSGFEKTNDDWLSSFMLIAVVFWLLSITSVILFFMVIKFYLKGNKR